MMYYLEIYLILGFAVFLTALITEFKTVVSKPLSEIAHYIFFSLTIWPYILFDECKLCLEDEMKAKADKLNEK